MHLLIDTRVLHIELKHMLKVLTTVLLIGIRMSAVTIRLPLIHVHFENNIDHILPGMTIFVKNLIVEGGW